MPWQAAGPASLEVTPTGEHEPPLCAAIRTIPIAMLAARNWVFCAPLWVGNSDRLVRSLLFRRVRAAVGRRVARSLNVAGPCAGLPTLLNGPVRIANWLACPLRLRAPGPR